MKRRDFVRVLGGAVVAGAAVSAVACGGDDGDGGGADAMVAANCPAAQISANHGHSLSIPMSDVAAGVEQTYNIAGSAGHAHTITVTAAQMTMLQNSQSVSVTSSNDDGHTHQVTVNC